MNADTNPEFALAMEMVEKTDRNLFLTGRAGTGKTTFLRRLVQCSCKRVVVTAPTGIAAINAGGTTLHSLFQLPFGLYLPGYRFKNIFRMGKAKIDLIRSIDLLIIDEVSMLRADLLDEVSDILKRYRRDSRPFGGVQLLMIGDLQQLAPIVKEDEWAEMKEYYASPYFFESRDLKAAGFSCVELKHIYRQNDRLFIGLLEKIRQRQVDSATFELFRSRYIPNFSPAEEEGYITLTTHNYQSDRINDTKLAELPGKEWLYEAEVHGNFPETSFPAAATARFKVGAQVMFIKNDSSLEKRYYNGKIGRITRCEEVAVWVLCPSENGEEEIKVEADVWENTRYAVNNETKEIKPEVEGSFKQIPLRLAWAITIHKSQGLTFDKVVVDAGRAFAHGQVYVALSRCRTLEGIVLRSPLTPDSIVPDTQLDNFARRTDLGVTTNFVEACKLNYRFGLIREQFNFQLLRQCLYSIADIAKKSIAKIYPRLYGDLLQALDDFDKNVYQVGERFFNEINRLQQRETEYQNIRCSKAAEYFLKQVETILQPLLPRLSVDIDNQKIQESLSARRTELKQLFVEKQDTLGRICQNQAFIPSDYLRAKSARFEAAPQTVSKAKKKPEKPLSKNNTKKISKESMVEPGQENPFFDKLVEALKAWRTEKYMQEEKPAYMILSQKALIGIAANMPRTKEELLLVNGIGKKKAEQYGEEILSLVNTVLE